MSILLVPHNAQAALMTWTGTTSNVWALNSNWSPSTAYPGSTTAYADQATLTTTTHWPATISTGITLGGATTSLTITGSGATTNALDIAIGGILGMKGNISNTRKITIEGTLSNDDTTSHTISGAGNMALNGGTISSAGGGVWTISQAITSTGTSTISAPVTDSSAVTASSGTLSITGAGSTFTGTLTSSSGATLSLGAVSVNAGNGAITDNGVVNLNGTTLNGTTTLFTAMSLGGTGVFNVTGTSSMTGNIAFTNYSTMNIPSGQTLQLKGANYGAYGSVTGGGNMTVNSGATLDNTSGASTVAQSTINLKGGQITNSGGGSFSISDNITGYGTVSGVTAITSGASANGGVLTLNGAPGATGTSLGNSSGSGANLSTAGAGNTLILTGTFTQIMPGNIGANGGLVQLAGATVASSYGTVNLLSGKISGYGTVSAPVDNKATITADGLGTGPQTLAFTNTIAGYANTGGMGWFARNQGRLSLPAINVSSAGSYNWGGDPTTLGLVNSIGMTLAGPVTSGNLSIALLSLDRADVPTGLTLPIGVWSFDSGSLAFGSASMTFRYDDALASSLSIDQTTLGLFGYNGTQWVPIPTNTVDTTNHLLTTASGVPSFYSDFAVAPQVPEPTTVALILAGLGMLSYKHRNRKIAK